MPLLKRESQNILIYDKKLLFIILIEYVKFPTNSHISSPAQRMPAQKRTEII